MKVWRVLLVVILLMSLVLTMSSSLLAEQITLTVTDWSATREKYFKDLIPKFEALNPDIKINYIRKPGGQYHDELQTAFVAGVGIPDLPMVEISSMGKFMKGKEIPFLDLTDWIKTYRPKLIESRLNHWSYFGKVWAVPQDIHPSVLIYRRDFFAEAGFSSDPSQVEKLLETWEKFVIVGQKLTKDINGDGKIDRYMIFLEPWMQYWLMILQQRSGMFDRAGKVILDDRVNIDTLRFVVDLLNKYKIAALYPSGAAFYSAVDDGNVVTVMGAEWHIGYVKQYTPKTAGKWGAIPLPAWPTTKIRTGTQGGSAMTITKACKHPEAAKRFIEFVFLSKDNIKTRWSSTYQLPPLRDALTLPDIVNVPDPYFGGQKFGALIAKLARQIPTYYMSPYWPEALDAAQNEIRLAIEGQKTPEQALKDAANKVRGVIK